MRELFRSLDAEYGSTGEVSVYCSYVQMYNERLFDLLVDARPRTLVAASSSSMGGDSDAEAHAAPLAIREHGVGLQREVR